MNPPPPRRGAGPTPRLRRRAALTALALALALVAFQCPPDDGFVAPGWWESRQLQYLYIAAQTPLAPGSQSQLQALLELEARDPGFAVPAGAVPDAAWDAVFDKVYRLRDTSDFDMLRLLNLLYAFRGHPSVSEALWQETEQTVLDFKYWYLDPTPPRIVDGAQVVDLMWYWTENHALIFHTCELLAGQMFPNAVFSVSGMTGAWHAERARAAILRWLDERARFGFTEFHSDVYYNLDIRPLLALVEWADDADVANRSAMVLDLVLLDMALHLHRGNFGATHGRSYIKDKAAADTQDTFDAAKLLFQDTALPYSGPGSSTGADLARAKKYRLPEVIRRIARSDATLVDRERMNLPLDEEPPDDLSVPPVAPFGLDFRDEANLPFWWSMGSQPAWMMLPLTLVVGNREGLFDAQFADFAALNDLVWDPADPEGSILFAQELSRNLWKLINQSMLKEVNTYTYRTQHYMLSTAQDYRKGLRGSQTHTWQATLDERAMVFTTHPSYLPVAPGAPVPPDWNWQQRDEPGPGYWTGESAQPRAAQHENVAFAIYAPQYRARPDLGFGYREETHAYFPHAHMDQVLQQGPWTFGRRGEAYVALYSWRPTSWRGGQPEVFQNGGLDFDLVAAGGADNVWIVECGSAAEWAGGFAAFVAAIAASDVTVTARGDVDGDNLADGFDVVYGSPSQGELSFGWEAPLVVDGVPTPIADYPRMDNPYVQVPFGEVRYEIGDGEYGLILDFDTGERSALAPAP